MVKKILLILAVAAVFGGGIGLYYFNKKVPSMATEKSELTVTASELFDAFDTDEDAATAKYVGKIVAVTGTVLESSTLEDGTPKVILDTGSDFGVLCEFDPNTDHARTSFEPGEELTIKGECAGLNLDVQLARCVVVQ
ncbi:MAG: hypothetical protein EP344_17140 [Bacteroidetes bacterium]|nr:MAG: hypothetical protein EP344_17140 [Bacteroidota bacterium]